MGLNLKVALPFGGGAPIYAGGAGGNGDFAAISAGETEVYGDGAAIYADGPGVDVDSAAIHERTTDVSNAGGSDL
eukprot:3342807-Rhodomonas_salina.1